MMSRKFLVGTRMPYNIAEVPTLLKHLLLIFPKLGYSVNYMLSTLFDRTSGDVYIKTVFSESGAGASLAFYDTFIFNN